MASTGDVCARGLQTVLVVDDEEFILRLARSGLGAHGYRVMTANSGAAGLALLMENLEHIDAVVTDVLMPELNGYEMVEALLRVRPAMPVVFMTGYAWDAPRIAGRDFVTLRKPFTITGLVGTVRECLRDGH